MLVLTALGELMRKKEVGKGGKYPRRKLTS
jgi:hypothetical protein